MDTLVRNTIGTLTIAWALLVGGRAVGDDEPQPILKVNAFVDTYFGLNLLVPSNGERPPFLYNHARQNEFSVNLAMVRASLETADLRFAVGLMAGTYVEDNLASEPPALRNIWEAVAGLRVVDSVWLEAGIFESHIGYESAISTRNPTLSRSLAAENSPYYLAGVRVSWKPAADWTLKLLATNGWQNLRESLANRNKAIGTQLLYEPLSGLEFNWSTWFSDESNGATPRPRIFNNIYAGWRSDSGQLLLNFDVGAERTDTDAWSMWYTFYLIGRIRLAPALYLNGRVEHFEDPDGIIVAIDGVGRSITGISVGVDVLFGSHGMWRLEARLLHSGESMFPGEDQPSDLSVTTSLAIEL